jgi:hypothetical protein
LAPACTERYAGDSAVHQALNGLDGGGNSLEVQQVFVEDDQGQEFQGDRVVQTCSGPKLVIPTRGIASREIGESR